MNQPQMTKKKALETLGLENNFNARDLKAAYRKAVKKYHTDIIGGDGEEIRDLIEAYECLSTNRFKDESQNYNSSHDNIIKVYEFIVSHTNILNNRCDCSLKDCPEYLRNYYQQFKNIINDFSSRCSYFISIAQNYEIFTDTNRRLNFILQEIEDELLKKYEIDKQYIGEIDYSMCFKQFVDTLIDRIKTRCSNVGKIGRFRNKLLNRSVEFTKDSYLLTDVVATMIKKILDDAIDNGIIGDEEKEDKIVEEFSLSLMFERYKAILMHQKDKYDENGFSCMSNRIIGIIDNILKNTQINTEDEIIAAFNQEMNKLLVGYHKSLNEINKLKKIIIIIKMLVGENSQTIFYSGTIKELENDLLNGEDIATELNETSIEIHNYYKSIEGLSSMDNNEAISLTYRSVIKQYSDKILILDPVTDNGLLREMEILFSKILSLYQSLVNGSIEMIDFLDCILDVDFDNVEYSIRGIKECLLGKSSIFINKTKVPYSLRRDDGNYRYYDFYYLKEEEGKSFMYYIIHSKYFGDELRKMEVNPKKIHIIFESIESVLSRSKYVGLLSSSNFDSKTYDLYQCSELIIGSRVEIDGRQNISIISNNPRTRNTKRDNKVDKNAGYEDPSELISIIKKKFDELFQRNNGKPRR